MRNQQTPVSTLMKKWSVVGGQWSDKTRTAWRAFSFVVMPRIIEAHVASLSPAISLFAVIFAVCISQVTTPAQAVDGAAQTSTVSLTTNASDKREFRFVSTNKAATMEKELNELAAQGFRLERVSQGAIEDDIAVLVVRDSLSSNIASTPDSMSNSTAGAKRYEYKILATRKTDTLEKEIVEAAANGYEFRGICSFLRIGIGMFIGDETIAVMERVAGDTAPRFNYKMLSTKREKTTQKELDAAVTEGYTPLSVARVQDNGAASLLLGPNFVINITLARPVESAGVKSNVEHEYKFLTTSKVSTMEKEMNQAVREGYRFHAAAQGLLMLMIRERAVIAPAPYEYKLLATRKTSTMQKELLEHGTAGYNYRATTSGLGGLTTVLEREKSMTPSGKAREYKLLATLREKTTQKEISDALAAGYRILDLTTIGEFVLVLEGTNDKLATTTTPTSVNAN